MATFHVRRLPHYHATGRPLFITWRLHNSLPSNRTFPQSGGSGRAFLAVDRILDNAAHGPQYLRQPAIAAMVVEAIRHRDPAHYKLHHFAVMPNHVHILITPSTTVSQLMQSLKRFTAREANRLLGTTGHPFWQHESHDRLVRNDQEFVQIAGYIEASPVSAGLTTDSAEFLWPSAT